MARVLLVAHQGIADAVHVLQRVHNGADGSSGVAEDMRHLLHLQAFYQGLRSRHANHLDQ